ncbi:phosphoglycerate mutase family protein [bacterium]|nr:MAG: phosphoglycerate mutase family protein [bacterium]
MSQLAGRPKQLILIRHAESARNEAKRGRNGQKPTTYFADEDARKLVKGIGDHMIPITLPGFEQAVKAGFYLKAHFGKPDFVYDSEYRRTEQTANTALTAFTDKELNSVERRSTTFLRERDPGYTYDMTEEEVERHFPYLREYWRTMGGFHAAPPGGESLSKVVERVRSFITEIFHTRDDQNVWIFTHGGTIRCIRYLLEHWTEKEFVETPGPDNCGITVYNQTMVPISINGQPSVRKKLVLDRFNDTEWNKLPSAEGRAREAYHHDLIYGRR